MRIPWQSWEVESHVSVSAWTEDTWFIWMRDSVTSYYSCGERMSLFILSLLFSGWCLFHLFAISSVAVTDAEL